MIYISTRTDGEPCAGRSRPNFNTCYAHRGQEPELPLTEPSAAAEPADILGPVELGATEPDPVEIDPPPLLDDEGDGEPREPDEVTNPADPDAVTMSLVLSAPGWCGPARRPTPIDDRPNTLMLSSLLAPW